MILNFNENFFQIKDSLIVYYLDNSRFLEGFYKNGLRDGAFKEYYKNGQLKSINVYQNNYPYGTWIYYYQNGILYKKIEYKDNSEFLMEMYKKNGRPIVVNGKGKYKDYIPLSIANSIPSIIKGKVLNGLPEGKWDIYSSGINIGTEYFKNNNFIKGISHSFALGSQEYFNTSITTFTGVKFIEHLKIIGPSICNSKAGIGLSREFFEKIREKFNLSNIKDKLGNCWFLVEIESDNTGKIKNIKMHSKSDEGTINEIKKLIYSVNDIESNRSQNNMGIEYFPVVIFNSKIYFPRDEEIELLKFKY
jgi:hypothetical protein